MAMKRTDPYPRFMSKVNKTETCWLWTGHTAGTKSTYGYFRPNREDPSSLVHRWMYEREKGPIPEGYEVDHRCRVALCVNPAHLEAVTPAENQRRRRLKVCAKGLHDLTDPANRRGNDSRGRSMGCRPCRNQWYRDRYRKQVKG